MYNPCSAPVGNQGPYMPPYNQAPHTSPYSAFPMHSDTVPSKNPMPYGCPNAENGPLNSSVGQMPNQSTQVQSASVPRTSQVVNNQDHLQDLESQLVVFREKEISLNEKTNQLEEEKTVAFESLSTEKNKNLAVEANISEFQVKVENLESELKTTNENFSYITSDIACSKETSEGQIKDFIETEIALKETMEIIEAEKEYMFQNLLLEIKKVEDLQINIEELIADLSTRKSEICEIIRNFKADVEDMRITYKLSMDRNAMHLSQNQTHPLLTANTHHHSENSCFPPPTEEWLDDLWLDDLWLEDLCLALDLNVARDREKELQLSLDDLTLAGVCDAARLPQHDLDDISLLESYGNTTETENGSFDSTSSANTSSPLPENNEIEMDSLRALRGQPLLFQDRNAMHLSQNLTHPLLTANTPHHSENSCFPPPTEEWLDDLWLDNLWLEDLCLAFNLNVASDREKKLQLSLDDLTLAGVCDAARLPQPDFDDLSSLESYGNTTETENGSFDSTSSANTSSPLPDNNEIEMDSLRALRGHSLVFC